MGCRLFSFQAKLKGVVSIKTAAIIDADLIGKARHKFPKSRQYSHIVPSELALDYSEW